MEFTASEEVYVEIADQTIASLIVGLSLVLSEVAYKEIL
jgi:hypothetical protein